MGYVRVSARIYNMRDPSRFVDFEGVVDTGAVYTVVPRGLLERIDVEVVERRRFKAFGGVVERDVGVAVIEIMGRRGGVTVIFGEEEDTPVIGVTALEALGLEVDPIKGTLKEATLYLL
ncbi:MAG: aspartyl protease [Candidatus Verstraetearchaeota archaeon]|nr:aspartyl protease [Candidatus Verstraetearchaeota archaeon]